MRLNTLTEQGEQHFLFQDLQTSQGAKLATMHDHQEGCLLLNLTCSTVHCHKDGDLVTGNKVMSLTSTLI